MFWLQYRMSIEYTRWNKEGDEEGLNVLVYAKKEYLVIKMREIRLGMEEGIDLSTGSVEEERRAEASEAGCDWTAGEGMHRRQITRPL